MPACRVQVRDSVSIDVRASIRRRSRAMTPSKASRTGAHWFGWATGRRCPLYGRTPTPTGSIGPIRPLARGAATAPTSSPAVATTRTDTEPVRRRRGSRPSGPAQVGHRHLHCGCGRGVVTRARLIPHPTGDDLDQEGKIGSNVTVMVSIGDSCRGWWQVTEQSPRNLDLREDL